MAKEFSGIRRRFSLALMAAMLGIVFVTLLVRLVFYYYLMPDEINYAKILGKAQVSGFIGSLFIGLALGAMLSIIFWKKIMAVLGVMFDGAEAVLERSRHVEAKWKELKVVGAIERHGVGGLATALGRAVGMLEAEVEIVGKALSLSNAFVCAVDLKGNILYAGKAFTETFRLVAAGADGPNIAQVLGDIDIEVLSAAPSIMDIEMGGVKKRMRVGAKRLDTFKDCFVVVIGETGPVEELRSEVRNVKRELEQRERKHEEVVDSLVGMLKVLDEGERDLKAAYNELKQTQAHLTQVSKLKALGEMSAVLAHELRQPLTVVGGLTQHLLKKEGMNNEVAEKLKVIDAAVGKMEKVIGHLRVFTRKEAAAFKPLDLNAVIDDAFIVVGEFLKANGITVRLEKGNLPPVIGDVTRLEQVIVNLVANAKDAMPGGGEIVLTTCCSETSGARDILLSVKDTGTGMDKETISRLFEPFFTTKEPGAGTGLGLSICRGIIREHGGNITVESEPGKGAVFTVKLPAAPGRAG